MELMEKIWDIISCINGAFYSTNKIIIRVQSEKKRLNVNNPKTIIVILRLNQHQIAGKKSVMNSRDSVL